MKFLKSTLIIFTLTFVFSCNNEKKNSDSSDNIDVINSETAAVTKEDSKIEIIPIEHATLILKTNNEIIYIDPTGGTEAFEGYVTPTLILITDIHGDHLNIETLKALNLSNTTLIGPAAVVEKLPKDIAKSVVTLNNDDAYNFNSIDIKAIPMYNLREEALKYHEKGRGNGYVLTINNERIYISGDTEDIPEMRNLENIDKAFICMNLPYTMPIESAADAVLEFKPNIVYPYHYRGTEGLSDIDMFKEIVNNGDESIEVMLLDWY